MPQLASLFSLCLSPLPFLLSLDRPSRQLLQPVVERSRTVYAEQLEKALLFDQGARGVPQRQLLNLLERLANASYGFTSLISIRPVREAVDFLIKASCAVSGVVVLAMLLESLLLQKQQLDAWQLQAVWVIIRYGLERRRISLSFMDRCASFCRCHALVFDSTCFLGLRCLSSFFGGSALKACQLAGLYYWVCAPADLLNAPFLLHPDAGRQCFNDLSPHEAEDTKLRKASKEHTADDARLEEQLQQLADSLALQQDQIDALTQGYIFASFISEDLFACRPLLGGSVATGTAMGSSDIDVGILLPLEEQLKHSKLLLQQSRALLKLHPWAVRLELKGRTVGDLLPAEEAKQTQQQQQQKVRQQQQQQAKQNRQHEQRPQQQQHKQQQERQKEVPLRSEKEDISEKDLFEATDVCEETEDDARLIARAAEELLLRVGPPFCRMLPQGGPPQISCSELARFPLTRIKWPTLRGFNPSGAESDPDAHVSAFPQRRATQKTRKTTGAQDALCILPFTAMETLLRHRIKQVPQQQQELRRRVKPLVRFGECDVTFNHQGPLHNSRMMRAYSVGCSPEVQRFLRLLKHWVKRRDVGDGVEGFTNSYSWQLAGVYFLQRCLLNVQQQQKQQQHSNANFSFDQQGSWSQLMDIYTALENPAWLPLLPNLQLRLQEHLQQQERQRQCAVCNGCIPYPLNALPEDAEADIYFFDPERGLNQRLSNSYVSLKKSSSSNTSNSSNKVCICGPWMYCGESMWPEDLEGLSLEAYARHMALPSATAAAAAAAAAAFTMSGYKHRLGQPPAASAAILHQLRLATKKRVFTLPDIDYDASLPDVQRQLTDLLGAVVLLPPGIPKLVRLLRAFFRFYTLQFDSIGCALNIGGQSLLPVSKAEQFNGPPYPKRSLPWQPSEWEGVWGGKWLGGVVERASGAARETEAAAEAAPGGRRDLETHAEEAAAKTAGGRSTARRAQGDRTPRAGTPVGPAPAACCCWIAILREIFS
ncbi:uncharacterized protein LOC34618299 [Cyclospora cayetanensis]|uniref:Uncharacterized protein LOC34618299 n=1 Tax=Cyclospora cayetanensis TaxID=88456 RepID=A0A6P6RWN5_9EIME|nr:uncharacterized protein LOC34618299 [Cyclospora cayetanensis]